MYCMALETYSDKFWRILEEFQKYILIKKINCFPQVDGTYFFDISTVRILQISMEFFQNSSDFWLETVIEFRCHEKNSDCRNWKTPKRCIFEILQMTVEFFKNFSRILVGKYSLLDPVLAFEDPQIARNETKTLFQTQHVSTFPGQKWLRTFEFFRTFYEKVWTLC